MFVFSGVLFLGWYCFRFKPSIKHPVSHLLVSHLCAFHFMLVIFFHFFILIYVMTFNDFYPLLIILPLFPRWGCGGCIYFCSLFKGSCSQCVRVQYDPVSVHTHDLSFSTHSQLLLISFPTCISVCHPFINTLIKLNAYKTPK